jgi:hypothetical protein
MPALNCLAFAQFRSREFMESRPLKKRNKFLSFVLVLIVIYLSGAAVVFDFRTAARPHDEEYFGERKVAFGPRPRVLFCLPAYQSGFDGHEWPFFIYRPVCHIWRLMLGYDAPSNWRN